jgi:hypothetical protein
MSPSLSRIHRRRSVLVSSLVTWFSSFPLGGFDPARFGQSIVQPPFGSRNVLSNFQLQVVSTYPICFCLSILPAVPNLTGETFYVLPVADDAPHLFTRNPESLVFFDFLPPLVLPRIYSNRLVRWNKSGNQVLVFFLFIPPLPGYRPLAVADRFDALLVYDSSSS